MSLRRRSLRRTIAGACVAAVALSACGGSDDDAGEPVVATDDGGAGDADGDNGGSAGSDGGSAGSDAASTSTSAPSDEDSEDSGAATTTAPAATPGEKPDVQVPDELPTELVVTELVAGTGPEAQTGDTVVVHYVGVRSEDGFEFDNSYDRGEPFPVVLGTGSVIAGWDQGLVGVQAGSRIQLDIPADLAYGDADRGDIRPGDALTFVIDVVTVEPRPVITAPPSADPADCPATDGSESKQQEFTEMQPFCIDPTATYQAEVVTNFGEFTIEFDAERAPQTVNNFVTLARYAYFDDTECHRVITDFVVQCGDPTATGFGNPGYTIPDELPLPGEYEIGSIAMANSGAPDSGGSQFFIITGAQGAGLPPQYSLFGQVVDGLDSVIAELNTLENPDGEQGVPPLETITIESVTITEL